MSEQVKWLSGPVAFHRYRRLLYTNFGMRVDFRYGSAGIARHLFWRFWWLEGDYR